MFCDEHGTADYCGECVYGPEIERLEAENKRLRAQQAPLNATVNKLRRENERLLEAFPVIALGKGLVEVAEGAHDSKRALIFGRNGTGVIGEPTATEARAHEPGETLAVVTFDCVASLDVVMEKLETIREALASGGDK